MFYREERFLVSFKRGTYLFAVLTDEGTCVLTGRCHRSQKRNELPYKVRVDVEKDPLVIIHASCECAIGLGEACGHVAGLLYTLASYQMLGHDSIPTDIACTSQPMSWHAPRGPKIGGKEVQNLTVFSYKKTILNTNITGNDIEPKGVDSTLYNPLRMPPPTPESYYDDILETFPDCMALCFMKRNTAPFVSTKFGMSPKGSVLSYQQKLTGQAVINLYDVTGFPDMPCRDVMVNNYSIEQLSDDQRLSIKALHVTPRESACFEEQTRLQSQTKVWYDTRKNRITASNFGQIAKRRKADVTKLVDRLKATRYVQTEAMRAGLAKEPEAAAKYCHLRGNNINMYPCGCVVSCSAPWLAASPDKKVYDPTKENPFGLLEIKCPESENVSQHECLEQDEVGRLQLKRNHNYFYQILCQLAVTGMPWCDFFVWCSKDDSSHCETIHFDDYRGMWQDAKDKVDSFYFEHFLQ